MNRSDAMRSRTRRRQEHGPVSAVRTAGSIALAATLVAGASIGCAQSFPVKPVRIISPYPPGGGNDTLARTIAHKLSEHLGQQVLVDNRPGANTIVGAEILARSAPDGYTMILLPNVHAINPSLYPKLPYDPIKDFAPLSLVGSSPLVLALHPSVPAKDVRGLVALARARAGQLAYGSSGNGSVGHMAGALFELLAGVKMQHIPYKGTAIMVTDVISGQISLTFGSALGVLPHVRSGRMRALAVTTERRTAAAPDLPTVAEAGLPGYSVVLWYGLVAPGATPPEIVSRLNSEIARVVDDPDIRRRLSAQGVEAASSTPAAFAALIASDMKKYADLIKRAGAKAE
jgi:tripartite-type tricarboxylate transporter receptor subunit TctC